MGNSSYPGSSYRGSTVTTATWEAQLGECQSVAQEVARASPNRGRTNTKKLRRKCDLYNDICKRLDFLNFPDKDEKDEGSVSQHFTYLVLVGRKGTHTIVRKKFGM